jgi:hypothetical protein
LVGGALAATTRNIQAEDATMDRAHDIFAQLDTDFSGTITRQEFKNGWLVLSQVFDHIGRERKDGSKNLHRSLIGFVQINVLTDRHQVSDVTVTRCDGT